MIQYIDDDSEDLDVMEQALEELGVPDKVVGRRNGEQALAYLKNEQPPFLILCDYKLPGPDGVALRHRIEAGEELCAKTIPFVFFSTTVSKATVEEVYNMNVQGLFEKATRFEEMKQALKLIYDYRRVCKHPNN